MEQSERAHRRPLRSISPERAQIRIRRLTSIAVLMATGATAVIGGLVAREHPGSAKSSFAETRPSTTTTRQVVTSGGPSR